MRFERKKLRFSRNTELVIELFSEYFSIYKLCFKGERENGGESV